MNNLSLHYTTFNYLIYLLQHRLEQHRLQQRFRSELFRTKLGLANVLKKPRKESQPEFILSRGTNGLFETAHFTEPIISSAQFANRP